MPVNQHEFIGADPGGRVRWVQMNPLPSETKKFFEAIVVGGAEFGFWVQNEPSLERVRTKRKSHDGVMT